MSSLEENDSRDRVRAALGSITLFLGIGILGLLLADHGGGLPFPMPRSWYIDRTLWVAAGFAALGGGWYLLRDRPTEDDEARTAGRRPPWRPADSSQPRFQRVVLYTRVGCHLCDHARETLKRHRNELPLPIEIDVDQDPALATRFGSCVPVVEIDGKVRFRGVVNEILLRRLIAATLPGGERRATLDSAAKADGI